MNSSDTWTQIPTDLVNVDQTNQKADDWAAQQRARLADTWAAIQRNVLSKVENAWQSDAQNLTAPLMPGYVQPTAPSLTPSAANQPEMQGANPIITPQGNSSASPDFIQAMREGASHAGVYLPPLPGSKPNPQDEANLALQAEQNKTRPTPGPFGGLGFFNPSLVPGSKGGAAPPEEAQQAASSILGQVPGVGGLLKAVSGGGEETGQEKIPTDILSAAKSSDAGLGEGKVVVGQTPDFYREFMRRQYPGAINKAIVKETVQNSVDASRNIPGAVTDVEVNSAYRSIVVRDQGTGMTPEVLQNEFSKLGGSAKSEGSSGGMGTAKSAFLGNAENFALRTVAFDPSRGKYVESILTGNGDDYLGSGLKRYSAIFGEMPRSEIQNLPDKLSWSWPTRYDSASGQEVPKTGTWLYVKPLKEAEWSDSSLRDFVDTFQADNTLKNQSVNFTINGEKINPLTETEARATKWNPAQYLPATEPLGKIETPHATLNVYGSKSSSERSSVRVVLSNAGQPQTSSSIYFRGHAVVPDKLVVDVVPKVGAKDFGYPWTADRSALTGEANASLENWVQSKLVRASQDKSIQNVIDSYKNGIPIVTSAASGKPVKLIDSTAGALPRSSLQKISQATYTKLLAAGIDAAHASMEKALAGKNLTPYGFNMKPSELGGLGISQKWLGLNVSALPEINLANNSILINPWSILNEVDRSSVSGKELGQDLSSRIVSTLLHEMAHNTARGHDEDFAGALTRIADVLGYQKLLDIQKSLDYKVTQPITNNPGMLNLFRGDRDAILNAKPPEENIFKNFGSELNAGEASNRANDAVGGDASLRAGSGSGISENNGGMGSESSEGVQEGSSGNQSPLMGGVSAPGRETLATGQQLFSVGTAGAAVTPQQPGESDQEYQARVTAGRIGTGIAVAGYLRGTPELEATARMLETKPPSPDFLQNASWLERLATNFTRAWSDNQVDVENLQNTVKNDLGLRQLPPDQMVSAMRVLNPNGAADRDIRTNFAPIMQKLGLEKQKILSQFLIYQHNIEIANAIGNQARKFSGGLTSADSQLALTQMQQVLGPQGYAEIQSAARQVTNYVDHLLQLRVDSGIITPQLAHQLRQDYPNYVPTRIIDHMIDETPNVPSGKSLSLNATGLKKLTVGGTEKYQEDPLSAIVRLAFQTHHAVAQNDTFNALHNLIQSDAQQLDLRGIRQVAQPNTSRLAQTVGGFVNGVHTYYEMPRDLAQAIQAPAMSVVPELQKVMSIQRGLFASSNPLFVGTHAMITSLPSLIRISTTEGGPQAIPRVAGALATAYAEVLRDIVNGAMLNHNYSNDWSRYLLGGGAVFGEQAPATLEQSAEYLRAISQGNVLNIRDKKDAMNLVKHLFTGRPVSEFINRIDLAPRVAAMRLAEKRGASQVEAVTAGRNASIDFARGGNAAKMLSQIFPFFNVGVQSGAQVYRTMRENPKAFLGVAVATLAAPTVAAEAWNNMTPERAKNYADVPNYYKNTGLVIMTDESSKDAQGNTKPYFIYIPLRSYAPFVVATRAIANTVMQKEKNPQEGWGSLLAHALLPTGSANDIFALSSAFAPSVPLPFGNLFEWYTAAKTGKDLQTGADIVTKKRNEEAGSIARGVAGTIDTASRAFGGRANASPAAVQYVENTLGGPGRALGAIGQPQGSGQPLIPFSKNATGQNLINAQAQRVGPNLGKMLDEGGIPDEANVRNTIKNLPLNQQEQAELQTMTNQALEKTATGFMADPRYARLPQAEKAKAIKKILDLKRQAVAKEYFGILIQRYGRDAILQRLKAYRDSQSQPAA